MVFLFYSPYFGGFFVKSRLGIKDSIVNPEQEVTIAIIDTGFRLSQFQNKKIYSPYNSNDQSSSVFEIPSYSKGAFKTSEHGSSMMEIFIGEYGILKNSKVIPIQLYSYLDLPDALSYAVKRGAELISISLSFAKMISPIQEKAKNSLLEASKYALILMAAGNDGVPMEDTPYGRSVLKMALESEGRIWLVGSTKFTILGELRSNFSNWPKTKTGEKVFFFAPGERIVFGSILQKIFQEGISGTSVATPIAAAAIILFAINKKISIFEAVKIIKQKERKNAWPFPWEFNLKNILFLS